MPRQEHVVSVFVASPGDLKDERASLEEIIREFNQTQSRERGFRFELVRWETNAYPGVGQDAQDVINKQIPNDYDVFIGIMWHRFGTPTGRADSGTIEEFEQAKKRHDDDPKSVQIMFYFKDAPLPPSHIDPQQLAKVAAFRKALGEEGTFYWTFNDLRDFERLLRIHVIRQAQTWHRKLTTVNTRKPEPQPDRQVATRSEAVIDEEDLGLLDLAEVFEERFGELARITERMTSESKEFGERISAHTRDINQLAVGSEGAIDPRAAKRLLAKQARDMDQFASRLEAEIPHFGRNLNEGMDALIQAVKMMDEFEGTLEEKSQLQALLSATVQSCKTLAETEVSTQQLREALAELPRMTTTLNRSKRRTVSVLDRLLEEYRTAQRLATEAEQLLKGMHTE